LRVDRSVARELSCGALSRQGLNPIKLVYDLDQPGDRLNLTASTFNHEKDGLFMLLMMSLTCVVTQAA